MPNFFEFEEVLNLVKTLILNVKFNVEVEINNTPDLFC